MLKWYIVVLAALAVILVVGGLLALILPEDYEGEEIYRIDRMHAVRMLDVLGGAALGAGCLLAWTAGILWQRSVHAS